MQCGEPDVDAFLDRISGPQLAEWREWAAQCAVGPEFDDARDARLFALLANVNRDTKKRPQPFEPRDFQLVREAVAARPRMTPRAFRAQFTPLVKKASNDGHSR